jgi:hypothetical protein
VTFLKVLTIYIVGFTPSIFFLLPLLPIHRIVQQVYFSICIYISTIFTLLYSSLTSSPLLLVLTSQTGSVLLNCSLFLKKKKDFYFCLKLLYRVFHCGISMYICIIHQIGSSPLLLSFLPLFSYGDFNKFNKFYTHSYIGNT